MRTCVHIQICFHDFFAFSQFVDAQKTKHLKDKSGAPLEYGDDMNLTVDIYKDSWPLSKYMTWYIPASVRDAKGVSIGDGTFQSRQWTDQDVVLNEEMDLPLIFDDDDNAPSSINSRSNTPLRSKSRSKADSLELTFANVASSLTTLIQKQNEQIGTQTAPSQQQQHNLKYAQMYEELDKILANAQFLDAVKFLTTTIESASAQFKSMAN